MKIPTIAAILGIATLASAEIFFHETFSDGEGWKERWTVSQYRDDIGKLDVSPGKWYADEKSANGLKTTEDYRFYAVSSKTKPFSNKDKDLVIQFDVKNEQDIDCGGSYLKIFNELDPLAFNGDSEYNIMFGPDICGAKAIVHAIFNYNGTNYNLKKTIQAPKDSFTHTYTLTVKPDQTYDVSIDGKSSASGSLLEDWDFLPPKTIKDPSATKPADWVDEAMIVDENDIKPEGYDDIPEFIPDTSATKPEDWDDDADGDWEPPTIANPDYNGPWSPKLIPNPLYKGEWVVPEIDNPEYKIDTEIYAYDFGNVGIDIWQVKSGTIFDNILITDDIEEAKKIFEENKLSRADEESARSAYVDQLRAEADAQEIKNAAKSADTPLGSMEDSDDFIGEDLDMDTPVVDLEEPVIQEAVIQEESKKPIKDEL